MSQIEKAIMDQEDLPESLRLVASKNHSFLATRRVKRHSRQEFSDVEGKLKIGILSDESIEKLGQWLLKHKIDLAGSYEYWVLWSLGELYAVPLPAEVIDMSPISLKPDLAYFQNKAIDAKLSSEMDALRFVRTASSEQIEELRSVAYQMKQNKHSEYVFSFLDRFSIVEYQVSRWLFWYIGAMDFAGCDFE